jgi:signal transduction histidine kinase
MFGRLRNNFLFFNMLLTSLVVLVAFTALYFGAEKIIMETNEELLAEMATQQTAEGDLTAGADSDSHYGGSIDSATTTNELYSLRLAFAGIGVVALCGIFGISMLFANRSIKPIRAALAQQHQFLADASHELKTPLAVMTANFDAAVSDPQSTIAQQQKWLDNLSSGMDRMNTLINRMLLLDKADAEAYDLQLQAFDVLALLEDELRSFAPLAKLHEITVGFEPDAGLVPQVRSDPVLIRQILDTLMDNAFKYTPRKGWIALILTRTTRGHLITITNSGHGIATEDLPHVFDRFYRSNKARGGESAGFGLGLAIAQKLAQTLGAKLSVESVVDKYTRFSLLFQEGSG